MKKIFLFIALMLSISVFAEGDWSVTFHPGNKVGLPDRYACIYTDADSTFTIMFRSDIRPIKITTNYCMLDHDSLGYTTIHIKLYDKNRQLVTEYDAEGRVEENTIVVTTDWKLLEYMMKGNYVTLRWAEDPASSGIFHFPVSFL